MPEVIEILHRKELILKKLKAKRQKWLRGFHAVFGCVWLGSAVCLAVIQFFVNPSDGMELYGIMHTIHRLNLLLNSIFVLKFPEWKILRLGNIYSQISDFDPVFKVGRGL